MRKIIIIIFILLSGVLAGYSVYGLQNPKFESLSLDDMRERIINERDLAIGKSQEAGEYHCCIEPPCTMCFLEANEWNNYTAGTCACDDLIAVGKPACPQCKRGPEEGTCGAVGPSTSCDIN